VMLPPADCAKSLTSSIEKSSRRALLSATGLLVCVMTAWAADASGELLARVRQRMADHLTRLPNYTCVETIERRAQPAVSRHFALVDRLRLEVAFVGQRELYSWPGARKFEEISIEQLVGRGGAIGMGSFAMHANAVFRSTAPEFYWRGEGERNGRKTVRFDFQVAKKKSRFAILTGTEPVIVAYRGSIEADAETLDLLQLVVDADELPPDLKLRSASEAIRYRPMRIGDTEFLLPTFSELSMIETAGGESRNVTQFESCREYAGVSTLRFDADSATGATLPAEDITLPAGVTLESRLRDAIDGAKAARGDPVHATVLAEVKRSGVVVVPKGAVLTGRITRIESNTIRSAVYFGVGLVFHTIEFAGRRGDFSGDLEDAGTGPNYFIRRNGSLAETLVYVKGHAERLPAGTRLALRTH
jgi:hypothetical protein